MARFETLTCDGPRCGETAVVPAVGWISTKQTSGSTTVTEPGPKGDFHTPNCLVQYFGAVAIQQQLEEAVEGGSLRLVKDGEPDE